MAREKKYPLLKHKIKAKLKKGVVNKVINIYIYIYCFSRFKGIYVLL